MKSILSVNDIMDSLVPISRFNKGEANKIFTEVKSDGVKMAIKNNAPECILVAPDEFQSMLNALEDYALYFEAEKRMKAADKTGMVSQEEIMEKFGITQDDLEDVEVEIE